MTKLKSPIATQLQKENFTNRFADIVQNNELLRDRYKIQFFSTDTRSNYVFNGLNGKSINILQMLTDEELEQYRSLKASWLT